MWMRLFKAAAVCAVAVSACQAATPAQLAWLVPAEQPVTWRAMPVSGSPGSQAGGMAYPAPNLAGFLLAIATHAVLQKSADEAGQRSRENAAEAVLQPYQALLSGWRQDRLARVAVQHLNLHGPVEVVDETAPTPGLVVRTVPVFRLEALERAVVLDNAITIHDPTRATKVFEGVIRVIGQPVTAESPRLAWLDQEGRTLEIEAARLLAHSVEVALVAARTAPPAAAAFKTQRFQFATEVKMERAAVVAPLCERLVMVTLRDTWLSAPRQAGEPMAEGCSPSLRPWLSAPGS
jgi:hypothetical protein